LLKPEDIAVLFIHGAPIKGAFIILSRELGEVEETCNDATVQWISNL
jgi:hypothetical protein